MTEEELQARLADILAEQVEDALEREQNAFAKLSSGREKSIVLFGTGKLGRKTLAGLRKQGIEPLAFSDNNPELWGKEIEGVRVLSPAEAVRTMGEHAVFVVTIWNDTLGHPLAKVKAQLLSLGEAEVVSFLPLYWKYPSLFLPYFCLDLPHKLLFQKEKILEAAFLFQDVESRRIYLANVRFRLGHEMDFESLPSPSRQHFNFDFFIPNHEEVFVDAGAFTGDTVRGLISDPAYKFAEIWALEPDPANHAALVKYKVELEESVRQKISTYQVAASHVTGPVYFDASGTDQAHIAETGGLPVKGCRLDELFPEKTPTFIKMDIEGAEPQALEGCTGLISKNPPLLAISVYHTFDHLWLIPQLIQRLHSEYSFFVRAHAAGGWDTMLYAVPPSRLAG